MARVAVIGDIGGHSEELAAALCGLGADPNTLELPDDLTVVQVGDLVHRGPDSTGVLDIVERQLTTGRWVQLMGNHETNEILPQFWFEEVSDTDRERIHLWRDTGQLRIAAAIDSDKGSFLVTHAGLTRGFYAKHFDYRQKVSASDVAKKLNTLAASDEGLRILLAEGCVLGGGPPNYAAGPIWADAGYEVRASWMNFACPFHQIHGHSSPYHWSKGHWYAPANVRSNSGVDEARRHVRTTVQGGKQIWGIDPCLGKWGGVTWAPFVLEGEVAT